MGITWLSFYERSGISNWFIDIATIYGFISIADIWSVSLVDQHLRTVEWQCQNASLPSVKNGGSGRYQNGKFLRNSHCRVTDLPQFTTINMGSLAKVSGTQSRSNIIKELQPHSTPLNLPNPECTVSDNTQSPQL
jgi:hypothetical protein